MSFDEKAYEKVLHDIRHVLNPGAYFRTVSLTIAQESILAWCRLRLFKSLEDLGYIVLPDYQGVDLVAFSPLTEKPCLAVQVSSTILSAKVRAAISAVGVACPKLYIVASTKKKRVYGQVSRLTPEVLCYAPYFGFVQIPVAMLDIFRQP